jgi:hypothetical protein
MPSIAARRYEFRYVVSELHIDWIRLNEFTIRIYPIKRRQPLIDSRFGKYH